MASVWAVSEWYPVVPDIWTIKYIRVVLVVLVPLSLSPPDPDSEVPHPSQVVCARQAAQSVVVDRVTVEDILDTEISNYKTWLKLFYLLKFDHRPYGSGDFITGLDCIFNVDVIAVVFIVVVIVEKICGCLSLQ